MTEFRRGIAPPWSRHTTPRLLMTGATIAVIGAYSVVAAAWSDPATPPARAATPSTSSVVAAAITPTPARAQLTAAPARRAPDAPVAPVIDPGALRAPAHGTYDVRVVTNGSPSAGTLYVGRDGSQRLRVGSSVRATRWRWSNEGDLLRTGEASGDGSCTWSPTSVEVAPNLSDSSRWSTTSTCTSSSGGAAVVVRREETAKVDRRVRTTLDGHSVDTWLIERHVVTSARAGAETMVTEEASSELFAPSLGLAVYIVRRTDVPGADGRVNSVFESIELVSGVPY